MRTTLNIDDQLFEEAVRLTGVKEKTALLRESLKALIQRESARRLAQLNCDTSGRSRSKNKGMWSVPDMHV